MATMMDDLIEKAAEAVKAPAPQAKAAPLSSSAVAERRFDVMTDPSRDALLTEFGKDTLNDRYLLPGESYQDLFARVAAASSIDHASSYE